MQMNTSRLPASASLTRYLAPASERLPKHARLRHALTAALDDGHWQPGDRLPTEIELTELLPFSLGTVQKAIRALVDEGRLRRVKGRGTFATGARSGISQPFVHARFLDDSGQALLPVYPKVVSRGRIMQLGPWSEPLAQKDDNIVRIERELRIDREFLVFSRFYINAERFESFTKKPLAVLSSGNYKLMLAHEYRLPPIRFSQELTLTKLPAEICGHLRVRPGTTGATLHVRAICRAEDVIFFHELFIPPNHRKLKLHDFVLPTG
jgi:DNA-binding GntR family transcriptional regulator